VRVSWWPEVDETSPTQPSGPERNKPLAGGGALYWLPDDSMNRWRSRRTCVRLVRDVAAQEARFLRRVWPWPWARTWMVASSSASCSSERFIVEANEPHHPFAISSIVQQFVTCWLIPHWGSPACLAIPIRLNWNVRLSLKGTRMRMFEKACRTCQREFCLGEKGPVSIRTEG